jgi:hypothetical protein
LGWFLFLLAVAGGVAFAIWNFHRKTAARKAASEARFEKIFKGSAQTPVSPPPAFAAPESLAPAKAPPAASAAPPAAAQRFLGEAESVLYYLLKSGLPGFEVFAGVSLARVVGAAGDGREQQLRRLAQYQLDFVVYDKNMQVVAVVEVESAAGAEAAGDRRVKSDLLKQAGVKLVRINPAALPPREQIRTFIGGGLPQ